MNLTGNSVLQADLIGDILNKIPNDDEDIMWVQVTQPLFNEFKVMIDTWNDKKTKNMMVLLQ